MEETSEIVPPTVARTERHISQIIDNAIAAGHTATTSNALSGDVLEEEVITFLDSLRDIPDAQLGSILEIATRQAFYVALKEIVVVDAGSTKLWTLLDVILQICETRQNGRSIVWYIIEELVESQTADSCRFIFDYLDTRRDRLTQREFQVTHLIILRTCNELLRRLSRAEDATFCGRVFFFLFQVFPLGEQSSVNLRGEFHTDNVTVFDDITSREELKDAGEAMKIDEETPTKTDATISTKDKGADEPDDFYSTFWRLQQDFSTPTRLIENDTHFATFKEGLEKTIERFAATPVVKTKSSGDDPRGSKRKRAEEAADDYQGDFNPKYLTSRDLFGLELSDLSFQRHILVQALILLDFLLSLSEEARKKLDESGIPKINTAVNYNFTLSKEKQEWVRGVRGRITTYLQEGPDGNFYHRMVNTVLARDKNWIWWKMQRCPPIVAAPMTIEDYTTAKRSCADAATSRRIRAKPMGAMDLTFLAEADSSRGLDSLRDPARIGRPSVSQLVERVNREELDLDFADDAEKDQIKVRMDSLRWRAVRAATRTSLAKLDKLEAGTSLAELVAIPPPPEQSLAAADVTATEQTAKTPEVQVM